MEKNNVFVVTNKGKIMSFYNRNEIVRRCNGREILDDEDALFCYVEDMGWEDIEVYPYEYAYYEDGSIDWINTRSILKHDNTVFMVCWGKEIDSYLAHHIVWCESYSDLYYVGDDKVQTIPLASMDGKENGLVIYYGEDEDRFEVCKHIYDDFERETVELLRIEREFCSQVEAKIRHGRVAECAEMERETPFGWICAEKSGSEITVLVYKINEYGEKYDFNTIKTISLS